MMGLNEQLLRLGRDIAAEQDRALAQDLSLGSVRARVIGQPLGRPTRRAFWVGAAALATAAAGVLVYGLLQQRAPLGATFGGHPLSVGEWVMPLPPFQLTSITPSRCVNRSERWNVLRGKAGLRGGKLVSWGTPVFTRHPRESQIGLLPAGTGSVATTRAAARSMV